MTKHYYYSNYCEGAILPDQVGAPDRCLFDVYKSGSILLVTLHDPTPYELNQFVNGRKTMRLTCIENAMWLTFKFGELQWMEAPYSPHLSTQADMPESLVRACSDFTISLVNTTNGLIKYCRRFCFNAEFSGAFRTAATMLLSQEFDREFYDQLLGFIQNQYSTADIAASAIVECQL